jgi:SNF2 family DNA or RNA helicase
LIAEPEGSKEFISLTSFPGLSREGPVFFSSNKANLVHSLYSRLYRKFGKTLKYSQEVKDIVEGDLEIPKLPAEFKYHTKPEPHQELALRFIHCFKNVGLLLEPGMGKTKVVLDYIFLENFYTSLIICPKPLRFVWQDEVEKHRPELYVYVVKTTDIKVEFKKIERLKKEGKRLIVVVNYDKAVILEKNLLSINWEFIGLDEGLIKDPTSERTRSITKYAFKIPSSSRCVMSGTLINNSPLDVFGPVRFLEPSIIGPSFKAFKDTYAIQKKIDKADPAKGSMIVGFRKVEEIRDILKSVSIVMRKEEWLKLPPKTFHDVYVQLSDVQRENYLSLCKNHYVELPNGDSLEVDNTLTSLIKQSQISNGFVYIRDSLTDSIDDLFCEKNKGGKKKEKIKGERRTFFYPEQPKIIALDKLIRENLAGERSIIWFNFEAEAKLIEDFLLKEGYTFLSIKGKEKNIGGKVRAFNKDSTIRFLLCQAKTINYGVTVIGEGKEEEKEEEDEIENEVMPEFNNNIFNQIFYSINFSLEVYLQQQDRTHRIGQRFECHYWRLIANTFIERKTIDLINSKMECNKTILVDAINSPEFQEYLNEWK